MPKTTAPDVARWGNFSIGGASGDAMKNNKSVALVAKEAATELMRRDVKDHGEAGSVRRGLVDAWRDAVEHECRARIGLHLKQGELFAVSMISGLPYDPRELDRDPTDAVWLLQPEQEAKALALLGQQTFTEEKQPATVGGDIDHFMLFYPEQLIDAFGKFTGMDKSWFKNLKDSPGLLAARKVKGRGGKNSVRACPLFCPFEVMQWLISPKFKKGRPLSERKGWQLLRHHFPSVFEQHQSFAPNLD
jgi:hypothetical protein